MEYVVSIFILGLVVTLLVAKGVWMANDYAVGEGEDIEARKTPGSLKS
jgi:hypothetical protein